MITSLPATPAEASTDQGNLEQDDGGGVGDVPMDLDACWSVASYDVLDAVPLELAEDFAVGVECRVSVFSSIEDDGWTELKMRDHRIIYLQRPSFVRDDTTNKTLDPKTKKTQDGVTKEIRALDSLRVGDAITKREADEYCREHSIRRSSPPDG